MIRGALLRLLGYTTEADLLARVEIAETCARAAVLRSAALQDERDAAQQRAAELEAAMRGAGQSTEQEAFNRLRETLFS